MSVASPSPTTFQQRRAHCSDGDLSDEPPFTVHGVAIGTGDVTKGSSGIKKYWPEDELKKAAESLQGRNLVVDHDNTSSGVVGQVTKAGFMDGTGVIYEAELFERELAEKIANGLLEVSIRGFHEDVDMLDERDDGAKVVENIEFDNLSIVPKGAAPSNTVQIGEHAALTAKELAKAASKMEPVELETDVLVEDTSELQEIEPADWVQWDDSHGIVIQVDGDEAEVDVYEEVDGAWRPIGETEMVSVDSLDSWDIDEDDVGKQKESDDSEKSEEENADDISADDFVSWDSSGGTAYGQVQSVRTSEDITNDEIKGDGGPITAEEDSPAVLVEVWQDGEPSGTMVGHKMSTLRKIQKSTVVEEAAVSTPEWQEGQMVQWQVNPEMRGKIVHVDREKQILMVEVMEEDNGQLKPSGFTITAGYTDVRPLASRDFDRTTDDDSGIGNDPEDTENESVSNVSVPFPEDVQLLYPDEQQAERVAQRLDIPGTHIHELDGKTWYMPGENHSVFVERMREMASVEENRVESEEEFLDSKTEIDRARKDMPEAYPEEYDPTYSKLEEAAQTYDDYPEAAVENAQMALDAREETGNPNDCGTQVGWERANQLVNGESLSLDTVKRMSQFSRHEDNSDMDDDEGKSDCGWMMWKAWGGDEGIAWAERTVEQVESENSGEAQTDEATLQEYSMHEVSFDGTTEQDWSTPDLEDFMSEMDADADSFEDLSEEQRNSIADHFFISSSGFPSETYGDLKLPVVEPSGELNINALAAAKGGRGVSAVDGLNSDMEMEIVKEINRLANEHFDRDWTMDEEENAKQDHESVMEMVDEYVSQDGNSSNDSVSSFLEWADDDMAERVAEQFMEQMNGASMDSEIDQMRGWLESKVDSSKNAKHGNEDDEMTGVTGRTRPVMVLSGDDLRQEQIGASATDSTLAELTQVNSIMDTTEISADELEGYDEPVAMERSDVEALREKADKYDDISENLSELRERTEVLDEVDREQVDELSESDDPVVMESARVEELTQEAQKVKQAYAANLAEEVDIFDAEELAEKYDLDELREKHEEHVGDIEEELAADPDPKSEDPAEEELEEPSDEEELAEEVQDKQAELRDKILN